ncbi:MAG: cytochrome P450 [Pseudomonadales bacterium]|nr:cytochrome P450 [Pseudomonadales bacterium]
MSAEHFSNVAQLHTGGFEPPELKGGLPLLGQIIRFAKNPYQFMQDAADELGEIAQFKMFNQRIILLTGSEASRLFYRASDEQLDQSAAYKLMTPIFGEGIIFDAPNERKNQQLRMLMPALRMEAMKLHADKIMEEVEAMMEAWGNQGEIDLVAEMKQLTINTASHCLLGKEFRYELTHEFAEIYHDLERGVNPLAYHFPNLPIPAFRARDKARKRLQQLVGEIVKKRNSQKDKPSDMFQTLIDTRYEDGSQLTHNEITGMLVGAIFAGHHTSSGTAAWVLLELLKQPNLLKKVREEFKPIFIQREDINFHSLKEIPFFEAVLKEVLRLHPPLIVLMRQVTEDIHFKQYTLKKGDMVWASPPVTHRLATHFKNPNAFDPYRFLKADPEDRDLMAYQPFGGGKHKCSGNAFAMFQIKAIFALLLQKYDFELADSPNNYVDDYGEMIVQPKSPCLVRYQRRNDATAIQPIKVAASARPADQAAAPASVKVKVDTQLCQGHAMCMGECPGVFNVDSHGELTIQHDPINSQQLDSLRAAINACPNQALTLEEQ